MRRPVNGIHQHAIEGHVFKIVDVPERGVEDLALAVGAIQRDRLQLRLALVHRHPAEQHAAVAREIPSLVKRATAVK